MFTCTSYQVYFQKWVRDGEVITAKTHGENPAAIEARIYEFLEAILEVSEYNDDNFFRYARDSRRNKHATERYIGMSATSADGDHKYPVGADYQRRFEFKGEQYAGVKRIGIKGGLTPAVLEVISQYTKDNPDVTFFAAFDIDMRTGVCSKTGYIISKGEKKYIPELICTDLISAPSEQNFSVSVSIDLLKTNMLS